MIVSGVMRLLLQQSMGGFMAGVRFFAISLNYEQPRLRRRTNNCSMSTEDYEPLKQWDFLRKLLQNIDCANSVLKN